METGGHDWIKCKREDFCWNGKDIKYKVDWDDDESIHNLISQLNMYCAKDMIIGLIGALFLVGIVIGCSTLTRMGDVYGRKPIYMLGICLHIGCMVGTLTTTSREFAFFLLFVFGLSVTSRYYVGYTYNIEMQPKSHTVLVSTTMFIFESVVYTFICVCFWFISDNWKWL